MTFGAAGDIAAPADYDGDGMPDLAVFDPTAGRWTIRNATDGADRDVNFGTASPGTVPVLAPLAFRLIATGNVPGPATPDSTSIPSEGLTSGSVTLGTAGLIPGLVPIDWRLQTEGLICPPIDRSQGAQGLLGRPVRSGPGGVHRPRPRCVLSGRHPAGPDPADCDQ